MEFKLTKVSTAIRLRGGGNIRVVNVTRGYCVATITTKYELIGYSNILTLAHYPMSVVLYEYKES